MKRRNFLKGVGAAAASLPIIGKAMPSPEIDEKAIEPETCTPPSPTRKTVEADPTTTRLWLDGEELEDIASVEMTEAQPLAFRKGQTHFSLRVQRYVDAKALAYMHLEKAQRQEVAIKVQMGGSTFDFMGRMIDATVSEVGYHMPIEESLQFTGVGKVLVS